MSAADGSYEQQVNRATMISAQSVKFKVSYKCKKMLKQRSNVMNAPTDPGEPADMHYTADCHVPESTHQHQ